MAGAGDPYRSRLNIVKALTAATIALAPELLEVDALEGMDLDALCGIIDNPTSVIDQSTKTSKVGHRGNRLVATAYY